MMDILEAHTAQTQSSNESGLTHVKVAMSKMLSILSSDKKGMKECCDQSVQSTIRRSMNETAVIGEASDQTWY